VSVDPQMGTTALDGSILLRFSLDIRLESESFEPLIDFLAFLFKKFGPKNKKLTIWIN